MTSATERAIIWTGTYTPDGGGRAEGIGALAASSDGTLQWLGTAAAADSPSFLAVHPSLPVVYAVAEQRGKIQAYRRTGDFGLEAFGQAQAAGTATCHIGADPQGRFAVACCWGDGQVVLYELDDDGGLAGRFPAAASVDPYAAASPDGPRQSRAHASLVRADGRVMTTDLGHDTLRVWTYVPGQGLVADHEVVLPAASGPRHLVQHPTGSVLVVTEYSLEVLVVKADDGGTFRVVSQGPATSGGTLPGDSAAEICLGQDGNYAYVGIRGSNIIGVLAVSGDGLRATPKRHYASGGDWPRHHLVRGNWLYVAHERSDEVAVFALDPESGLPGPRRQLLNVPSPTALVPAG